MANLVPREELKGYVGKQLEPGSWFTIDQDRINHFADVSLDHQFIHVDEEAAAQSPFGGTIAHGFLTLSMLTHLVADFALLPDKIVMGINYGFDKVRFLAPVRAGKRVRAVSTIADVQEKEGNRVLIKQAITVEIEGEETPALVAEWLGMYVCG
jgi:acyl dehydratase